MRSEDSILVRCASNMAGRAAHYQPGTKQQAMMWMAQMFVMVDRDADMNHLVRCSARHVRRPRMVVDIRRIEEDRYVL
jgi:hypothetical protein